MGIQSEELRVKHKNQHLPTHDLCLNQTVMYQEPIEEQKVVSSENHKVMQGTQKLHQTTEEGMQYRKMQMHLKPY